MRLAGFYRYPIEIILEEDIEDIETTETTETTDEDTIVKGRLDILAVTKAKPTKVNAYFWVLLIESKNGLIDVFTGLPQLLTYAYKSLAGQNSVWGLVTNGRSYQFVYIQQKEVPIYHLMPLLNLMESPRAIELLQVLKAICQL